MADMPLGPVTFSAVEGQEFGSFHYHLGLVHHSFGEEEAGLVRTLMNGEPARQAALEPTPENVAAAFRVASLFHETRHLIDGFGTLAGISLFGKAMELLRELCHWASVFGAAGVGWQLPLRDWVMSKDCPQEMRDFVRRLRAFHQAEPHFLALFEPFAIEGHNEQMLIEVAGPDGRTLKAFPIRMTRAYSNAPENVTLISVLCPLGYEALVEGSAHAICRNLVAHLFPKDIADELVLAVRFKVLSDDDVGEEDSLLSSTPPYMITDLMISRFLRSRGVNQFPRDTVLGMTDLVLSQCWIETVELGKGLTGVKFDDFGDALLKNLEHQSVSALAQGRVETPERVDAGYRILLQSLEQGGDWDSVEDDLSPLSSVMIWESYCAQNLTVPLLRKRGETGHAAFQTNDGFFELLPIIQDAAIRAHEGQLQSALPKRVTQAWAHVVMLSALARQMATDKDELICPRRFGSIPGIASVNFAQQGHCDIHGKFGCGEFRPGVDVYEPPCLFEHGLRFLRLSRH
ncbi:hypothetical protein JQK15_25665 [Sphingobium sp. BHU LFT2]|uniref:hypothetical protein n=1 Tax=Sphingobium sp. BHU LFT2 TaxID=2807634 RepID=UPI001BE9720F|nr:hypothetical protein [Sphingobium sp. BHU LFT2]MBT2246888.1 hypothetical protein [Sphingobium sp. BHU LFT2]